MIRPPTRFVIFCSARTGSTMLVSALHSIQHVFCLMAIFREETWISGYILPQLRKSLDPKWNDLALRTREPLALLDEIADVIGSPLEALGFKHHFNMDAGVLQAMISAKDVRKIVLRRDNELAAYASQLKARQLRLGASEPILFAPKSFAHFCRRRSEASEPWTESLQRAGALEVAYSEVRRDISRVLEFLDLPLDTDHVTRALKRGSDDILSRFDNPDTAAEYLKIIGKEDWATEN